MTEPTVNVGELIDTSNKLIVTNARMRMLINQIEGDLREVYGEEANMVLHRISEWRES